MDPWKWTRKRERERKEPAKEETLESEESKRILWGLKLGKNYTLKPKKEKKKEKQIKG